MRPTVCSSASQSKCNCSLPHLAPGIAGTVLTCAYLTVERVPKQGVNFGCLLLQLPDVQLLRSLSLHEVMVAKYTEAWPLADAEDHMTP